MLKSLYISSFVLIDEMRLDFNTGMSVLTGETGAGKSIIIDAIGQLCGQRASASFVKNGSSKAYIEGIFDAFMNDDFKKLLDDLHIEEEDEYVISKEISANGKSVIKINEHTASTTALKRLMPYFIDIHSQFETQKLFEVKNHICMLDDYGKDHIEILLKEYSLKYSAYRSLEKELMKIQDDNLNDEELDYLQSQLDELSQYEYTDEEIEELEQELKILQNHEKLHEHIQQYEQSMESILPIFKDALYHLETVLDYGEFQESYDSLYNYYYNIIEEKDNIIDTYHQYQFDEYRFNELQDLLFQINRIKRKYGYTMERINEVKDELQEKIDLIINRDSMIEKLTIEVDKARKSCLEIAEQLHKNREYYASLFEEAMKNELKDLYLDKALFKIHFEKCDLNALGFDQITFKVSMNQGQSLSLLSESASGGEISRIMLAIKILILTKQNIETIIFDEVDTGISGKVARAVGRKILALAQNKQVICISHLPQVASLADYHYHIEKHEHDDQTSSSIVLLNQEQRVHEIATMLSGNAVSLEAIENAKQLLNRQ